MKVYGEFKIKELHNLYNTFDIDNNGVIDKEEFRTQLFKARKIFGNRKSPQI